MICKFYLHFIHFYQRQQTSTHNVEVLYMNNMTKKEQMNLLLAIASYGDAFSRNSL